MRHQKVLEGLGLRTDVVSRRPNAGEPVGARTHADLVHALRETRPDHVVIANETAAHLATLVRLAEEGFAGTVVVEKPVTASPVALDSGELPFRDVIVGYQLRFHPAVAAARTLVGSSSPIDIEASVGQHLSSWRPGRDIGDTASARVEDGGGVLRDLSHELDLVLWFAGDWRRVCALGGRSGALGPTVATDDRWGILIEFASGAVATVHLDSLDRLGRRRLSFVAAESTVAVDLLAGTVAHVGANEARTEYLGAKRDDVLAVMHRALLDDTDDDRRCSIEQGMAIVRLIDAIERSVRTGGWVEQEASR